MQQRIQKTGLFVSLAATSFFISSLSLPNAQADDEAVSKGLDGARALFEQRGSNPASVDQVLTQLRALEGQADDSDLNYDVLILESRAYYWKGKHAHSNDERMDAHKKGQNKADAAKDVDDSYADAYYYAGINLARWGEANGVINSLFGKDQLIGYMKSSMNHKTRADTDGKGIDGYGPSRVLGRMLNKLPEILGGSHRESLKHLEEAYTHAKDFAINAVYYAEALKSGNDRQKDRAKQILDELLSNPEASYNVNRIPETMDEFEDARRVRASLN